MVAKQKEILLEVNKIHMLLYGQGINEQFFGPIMTHHTMKGFGKIADWIETWDKKDWLTFIELTTGLLALIPTPATPVLFAISSAAGLANAKVHWDEGYKYEAGLMIAFSLLGAGALVSVLKNSKVFMKLGKEGSKKLIEKAISGTATNTEKKMLKQLVEEITPVADDLAKATIKETIRRFIIELPKKSTKFLIGLLATMYKIGKFGVKEGIVIAGTFLAYDKIYLALNHDNIEGLSNRDKNGLVKIYKLIKNNEQVVRQDSFEEFKKAEPKIEKNYSDFVKINADTTYEFKFVK